MGKIILYDKKIAEKVALRLLDTKSVSLQPDEPFTWASGLKSPIYCDNRRLLSFPDARSAILTYFHSLVHAHDVQLSRPFKAVAGVATGAIPIGALLAHELKIPFYYIRSEKKGHGKENLIEGALELLTENILPVIIVEDLISTGGSSIAAAKAMQEYAPIAGMLAIFSYNLPKAVTAFAETNFNTYVLCDYPTLLEVAVDNNYVTKEQEDVLRVWNADPKAWSDEAEKRMLNQ